MGELVVEAFDRQGRRRSRFVNVIAGDLVPEAEDLTSVASVRITDAAIDLMEPQLVQQIEAQRTQLVAQALATPVPGDTKIKGFSFGRVGASLDLVPGGMAFRASFSDVAMDIEHKAKVLLVLSSTKRGTVRANAIVIENC